MNKILVDEVLIIVDDKVTEYSIKGDTQIYINNLDNNIELKITLEDNADLKIYDYNTKNKNTNIEIIQNNNSKCNYYHSFKIEDNYNLKYKATINGHNNINNINISGVTKGVVNIEVDTKTNKNTKDNECNEIVRILNDKGVAYISPMLEVDSKEVIANHNTTISNIREDYLLYLMSKGIEKKEAIKLIANSYQYGAIKNNQEFYEMIKK